MENKQEDLTTTIYAAVENAVSKSVQPHFDVFNDKLDTIIQQNNIDHQNLSDSLAHAHDRITRLDIKMEKRFDAMDKKFTAKFEQVDEKFEQVDKRFSGIDSKLVYIDQRFDRLESVVEKLAFGQQRITSSVTELHSKFNRLAEAIERHDTSLFKKLFNPFSHL